MTTEQESLPLARGQRAGGALEHLGENGLEARAWMGPVEGWAGHYFKKN